SERCCGARCYVGRVLDIGRRDHMTKQLDGVFEGGGVRGIGLVGALSVIEEAGYEFVNLAGSSAGAIVATPVAAGYGAADTRPVIDAIGFRKMTDDSGFGRVAVVGKRIGLLVRRRMYRGHC